MISSKEINFVIEEASRVGKILPRGGFLKIDFCEICYSSNISPQDKINLTTVCGSVPPLFGLCKYWSLDDLKLKGLLKNISQNRL